MLGGRTPKRWPGEATDWSFRYNGHPWIDVIPVIRIRIKPNGVRSGKFGFDDTEQGCTGISIKNQIFQT
jgi:hypothetical protein